MLRTLINRQPGRLSESRGAADERDAPVLAFLAVDLEVRDCDSHEVEDSDEIDVQRGRCGLFFYVFNS